MRLFLLALPVVLLAQAPKPAPQAPPKPAVSAPAAPGLDTDDEKIVYALGMYMYQSLGTFNLSPAEVDLVKKGFADAAAGKGAVDLNTWGPKISKFAQERGAQAATREKAAGEAFLAKAAAEPGAEKTATGLVYRELRAGTGASPVATDKVKVHYKGTLTNGTEFDSSYKRNSPAEFTLTGVIPCWTEGVQKMKVGGKASLTCPSGIAYGDRGHPPAIPGGATLVFEVELLEIAAPPAPPMPPVAPPAPAPPTAPGK